MNEEIIYEDEYLIVLQLSDVLYHTEEKGTRTGLSQTYFQAGDTADVGANGTTELAELAVLKHRLEAAGETDAIEHIDKAIESLT